MNGFVAERLAQIPVALQGHIDSGDLSGVVTLIWRGGEVAQVNTVGWRDLEQSLPMQRDTLFRIASMTKPITSLAALMLLDEGKLALSDPITRWASEFGAMRVLRDPAGSLEDTYPASRVITIDDLMTHRAGLAAAFTSTGPIAKAHETLAQRRQPDDWMAALGRLPLTFEPGQRFHYGHSTDVLGLLVGRIAGMSFRDFLRTRVFGPLGMHDTDFWIPPVKRTRAANVYRQDAATNSLKKVPFPDLDEPPALCSGAGGLVSTADDYLKFARLLLNGGALDGVRLLSEKTVALMRANRLTPAQREIPFMGFPFWAGQGFGLGLSVVMDPEKRAWMGMGSTGAFGWPGAFGTWWQADPVHDMVLLYLIQNSMVLGPDMAAQLATGQRMGARVALPTFQRLAYAALDDAAAESA